MKVEFDELKVIKRKERFIELGIEILMEVGLTDPNCDIRTAYH
jgi:hypothetical protein